MLSFVVQNFNSKPVLVKTLRSLLIFFSKTLFYYFLFFKNTLLYVNSMQPFSGVHFYNLILFKSYFYSNFWSFFKSKFVLKNNLQPINNITKALYYYIYRLSIDLIQSTNMRTREVSCTHISYVRTIGFLNFPFHKKTYNTFIFFLLFLLTSTYFSFTNNFNLMHTFIYKPSNFNLFFFLNRFYFITFNV